MTGAELNGTTTAHDLGLGRMMSTQKDYIGRVLAARPGLSASDRPALIGVKPSRLDARLTTGAHFLRLGAQSSLANDEGFISSVTFSPILGHWIGLGFLRSGRERIGEWARAHDPLTSGDVEVEITNPVFYDPDGKRLKVLSMDTDTTVTEISAFAGLPTAVGSGGGVIATERHGLGIARIAARRGQSARLMELFRRASASSFRVDRGERILATLASLASARRPGSPRAMARATLSRSRCGDCSATAHRFPIKVMPCHPPACRSQGA